MRNLPPAAGRRKTGTARRGFRVVLGALAALLVSCQLIPEIEGEYPAARIPERSGGEKALFDNRREPEETGSRPAAGEEQAADSAGEQTAPDGQAAPDEQTAPDEQAVADTPAEEPVQRADDLELPDAEFELAETDYPEKAPEEPGPPPPPVPAPSAPAAQPPPGQPPVPPAQFPSTPTPPASPAPRPQRPPPPPPPPTARPSRPVPPPPPAREEPPVPPSDIPALPFQPVPPAQPATPGQPVPPAVPPGAPGPVPPEPDLTYSRTVKALVGQYIEIPFLGPGWVYLGEFGSRRGVSYDSRRMEDEGMTFVFRADEEGIYSLKFDRQDFVRDYILNDYVKVIVEPPPVTAGSGWSNPRSFPERVYVTPRWPPALDNEGRAAAGPPAVPVQPAASGQPPDGAPQRAGDGTGQAGTVPPGNGVPPEDAGAPAETAAASGTGPVQAAVPAAPEDWLAKAREEYNAGRIAGALGALDQFMLRFPGGSDEAFWLYGQSYEANNEATRDIRRALDYYRRLTGEYPQSTRYDDARRRIVYLERFYFNIR